MAETIYLRMRHRIQKKSNDRIFLKDLAQIIATDELLSTLKNVCLYHISAQDKNIIIIDSTQVIREIKRLDKEVDIQLIGPPQTIIEVVFEKRKVTLPFFILVWLLLFIGSGLTIMNFHEDVSMQTVHQRVYKMITGKEVEKPLIFQIPYSIGLGLGMVIFFNHVFKTA